MAIIKFWLLIICARRPGQGAARGGRPDHVRRARRSLSATTGGALVRRAPPGLEPDRSPSRAAPALRAATTVAAAAQVVLGGRDAFTRRAVGAGRRRSRRNRHAPLRSELAAFEPRLGARGPTNATASTYRSRWPQPLRRQYPRGGRRRSHLRNIASRRTGLVAVGRGLGALLWRTAAEPWEDAVPNAAPTA